jgi:hypothetical protein
MALTLIKLAFMLKNLLRHALKLNCPLCGNHPLLRPKSHFEFAKGCPECKYFFEREEGYFSGAAWMIGYPIIGLSMLVGGLLVLQFWKNLDSYSVALVGFAIGIVFGIAAFPWFRSLWMVFDLYFQPLSKEEHERYADHESKNHK